VVGFTICSRGKVPGKICEKRIRNDDDDDDKQQLGNTKFKKYSL
jgi:hypothetical protein